MPSDLRTASTGKGTGFAAGEKAMRVPGVSFLENTPKNFEGTIGAQFINWVEKKTFIEVPQGYSLGANAGFWPTCTHRECTVMQGMADAQAPAHSLRKSMMVIRTYPIRVGNTEGSSGAHYPDQREMTWEELGVTPERTTVTKRIRRVFSFSKGQVMDAIWANRPDVILFNFANYMKHSEFVALVQDLKYTIRANFGYMPDFLYGYGPGTQDVHSMVMPELHKPE